MLTLSVTAVLAARLGIRHGAGGAVCAAVAIVGWGLAGLWALRRVRQLTGPTAAVSPGMLALGALFVSGYALLGLVMLFIF